MKKSRSSKFKEFNRRDLYTIILYALYKLTNNPEYSTLAELMFIMESDKELLNLCSVLGGTVVKIPTVSELKLLIQALAIVEEMASTGYDMDQAYLVLGIKADDKKKLKELITTIGEIVDGYSTTVGEGKQKDSLVIEPDSGIYSRRSSRVSGDKVE